MDWKRKQIKKFLRQANERQLRIIYFFISGLIG